MSLCALTLRDRDKFALMCWSEVQQQEVENAAFLRASHRSDLLLFDRFQERDWVPKGAFPTQLMSWGVQ